MRLGRVPLGIMSSLGMDRLFKTLHIVSANRKNATFNAIVLLFCLGEVALRSQPGKAFSRHLFSPWEISNEIHCKCEKGV